MKSEILSRQNPKIKTARALARASRKAPKNLLLVEGIRHVGEAVESGWMIRFILYCPELLTSEYAATLIENLLEDVDAYEVSEDILESIANKKDPQGILAVVEKPELSLDVINDKEWDFLVALEQPQDPGNVGTVLRTMDAAGADALIIIGGGVNPYHPKAIRASMGTHFNIPLIEATRSEFLDWQAGADLSTVGTSANAVEDYRDVVFSFPILLLMGSERSGLSDDLQEICDEFITIPMRGKSTSMNLAVSTGILLYQIGNILRE